MNYQTLMKRSLKKELCLLLLAQSSLFATTGTIANEGQFVTVLNNTSMMTDSDFTLTGNIPLTMASYTVARNVTINDSGAFYIDFGAGARSFVNINMFPPYQLTFNNELRGSGSITIGGGGAAIEFNVWTYKHDVNKSFYSRASAFDWICHKCR